MARPGFLVRFDWLNGPDGGSASSAALGAWLRFHAFSAQRATAGRIVGCKGWSGAKQLMATRVRPKERDACIAAGLASWDADDLVLAEYDHAGEVVWTHRSEAGKRNAAQRWGEDADGNAIGDANGNAPFLSSPIPSSPGESSPSPGVAREASGSAAATATAKPTLITGYDPAAARRAIETADFVGLVRAYNGNLAGDRAKEWGRDCQEITVHQAAVILHWKASQRGKAIREPSGFRAAWVEWGTLDGPSKRKITAEAMTRIGLDAPPGMLEQMHVDRARELLIGNGSLACCRALGLREVNSDQLRSMFDADAALRRKLIAHFDGAGAAVTGVGAA